MQCTINDWEVKKTVVMTRLVLITEPEYDHRGIDA
jgi:hypothetical protein